MESLADGSAPVCKIQDKLTKGVIRVLGPRAGSQTSLAGPELPGGVVRRENGLTLLGLHERN